MKWSSIKFLLSHLNSNTLKFNFKYFPFRQACRFPVFVSSRVLLKSLEGKVSIEAPLRSGMINIGFGDVGIFDRRLSRSIWEVKGSVSFNGTASIGHGSKIAVGCNGHLSIGDAFSITAESSIVCFYNISIGSKCLFSWDILIMDTDFHKIYDQSRNYLNPDSEIRIGNNVWIGTRATILKGSHIADGSVIAAGTTVARKIERPNCIHGGEPLRVLKEDISWAI